MSGVIFNANLKIKSKMLFDLVSTKIIAEIRSVLSLTDLQKVACAFMRIDFKILLFNFKALDGLAPDH